MGLFARKRKTQKPERHELVEIPIGSMIELSDPITFETSDTPSRTFELIERKKYEGESLMRYMYLLKDRDEVVVLGVDQIGGTDEFEVSRWIIDSEEELDSGSSDPEEMEDEEDYYFEDDDYDSSDLIVEEAVDGSESSADLPDSITLHYPDPDDEDMEILVEYVRQTITPAKMTVVNAQTLDEYDVELHEYANEDEELMCVEHCGNWLTFYVGALISQPDVNVYPAEEEAEYI
jgi:hypothetical protein